MRRTAICVLIMTCVGLCPTSASAKSPVIIAHRGASGYLPEHTLEAVAMAHAQGADYIEQDLVLSKDLVPVVLHDVEIDTVTDVAAKFPTRTRADGRWYAIDFTVAELKTLNVHERVDLRTGKAALAKRFPVGRSAFSIPTLEEELQLIQGLNASTGRTAGIYPELKSPGWHRRQGVEMTAIILEILKRYGYAEKSAPCYLQCFELDELRRVRAEHAYAGKLVALLGGRRGRDGVDPTSPQGLDEIATYADGIGPALPLVIRSGKDGKLEAADLVRLAHDRKLVVHPYTVRSDALPSSIENVDTLYRLIFETARVDGVFTDHPDQGVSFVRKMR